MTFKEAFREAWQKVPPGSVTWVVDRATGAEVTIWQGGELTYCPDQRHAFQISEDDPRLAGDDWDVRQGPPGTPLGTASTQHLPFDKRSGLL